MDKKKTIAIGIVIVIALLGVALFLFFAGRGEEVEQTDPQTTQGTFPFGEGGGEERSVGEGEGEEEEFISSDSGQNVYRRITNRYVKAVEWVVREQEEGSAQEVVRFVDRTTGHIYESEPPFTSARRVSNTTIPAVQRVAWTGEEGVVGYQYEEDGIVQSFVLTDKTAGAGLDSQGFFLPFGVPSLTGSPSDNQLALITESSQGSSIALADAFSEEVREIQTLPLQDLSLDWVTPSTLLLYTNPSSYSEGSLYTINPSSGALTYVLGEKRGFKPLMHGGTEYLLYSYISENNLPELRLYNRTTNEDNLLPLPTLADKCVWANTDTQVVYCAVPQDFSREEYPDAWYRGEISFNDYIWKINTQTGELELLLVPSDFDATEIDATSLTLSDNDRYLFFINKKDSSLWSLVVN